MEKTYLNFDAWHCILRNYIRIFQVWNLCWIRAATAILYWMISAGPQYISDVVGMPLHRKIQWQGSATPITEDQQFVILANNKKKFVRKKQALNKKKSVPGGGGTKYNQMTKYKTVKEERISVASVEKAHGDISYSDTEYLSCNRWLKIHHCQHRQSVTSRFWWFQYWIAYWS